MDIFSGDKRLLQGSELLKLGSYAGRKVIERSFKVGNMIGEEILKRLAGRSGKLKTYAKSANVGPYRPKDYKSFSEIDLGL